MAVSDQVTNSLQGKITLTDGTGTPVALVVAFDNGDVSVSEYGSKLNAVTPLTRRGKLLGAVYGDRVFPVITFTARITDLSVASGGGTLLDFLLQRAAYSANVSTLGAGKVYTVDFGMTIYGSSLGSGNDETVGATKCVPTVAFAEGIDGNTVNVSLQVLGAMTGAWAAAEASLDS